MIETLLILLLAIPSADQAPWQEWRNECPEVSQRYCANVGKTAHNSFNNPPILRGKRLGTITGVTWRPRGSTIALIEGFPDAGIPPKKIEAPRDALYYIIDASAGPPFLRQCADIDAKEE